MRKRMECVWDGVSEVEMESARPPWWLDWVQRVRTSWRGWASWGWFVEWTDLLRECKEERDVSCCFAVGSGRLEFDATVTSFSL
jgi:hypothetical protein